MNLIGQFSLVRSPGVLRISKNICKKVLKRKFEPFCLLCLETMRKMSGLLSFGFLRTAYKQKNLKKFKLKLYKLPELIAFLTRIPKT